MSSITRASKGKKVTDLTDDSTVLTNKDSTNRLMIWNDKHVKVLDDGGWKCLWCKKIFKFSHATRALCHFLKLKGNHVAICKAIIPVANLEHYHSMRKEGTDITSANRRTHEGQQEFIEFRQEAATSLVLSNIEKKNNPAAIGSLNSYVSIMALKKRRFVQMSVDVLIKNWQQADVRKSNNTRLQMATTDLVNSDGHAFFLPKSKRFTTVLRLAKTVGPDFKVPGRNHISGILLDRNFESYWEAN